MGKKFGITREQYKNVKRMDHKQMETFMVNIYIEGFKDGTEAAAVKRVKPSDIAAAVTGVKGVGEKKAIEIMEVINALYLN
ncbi:MAG: hypothetical protein K0R00_921 [Herbinix sp.]|jgi:hypothetical protein|nr:hypothetical protein [Herbinix sp.]